MSDDAGISVSRFQYLYLGFMFMLLIRLRNTHKITSQEDSIAKSNIIIITPKSSKEHTMSIIVKIKLAEIESDFNEEAQYTLKQIEHDVDNLIIVNENSEAINKILYVALVVSADKVAGAFHCKQLDLTTQNHNTLAHYILLDQLGIKMNLIKVLKQAL